MRAPLRAALLGAVLVEGAAGLNLVARPRGFIAALYGRPVVEDLTLKFARRVSPTGPLGSRTRARRGRAEAPAPPGATGRTSGVALLGYAGLAAMSLGAGAVSAPVVATFALYNLGATVNNAAAAGLGSLPALLHAALAGAFAFCLVRR